MVIEYLSHDNRICQEDLSKEKIQRWYFGIDNSTNENIEYLRIDWEYTRTTRSGLSSVGIYPPLSRIKNKDEVISWLKNNHSEKQVKQHE